jgi:hypothetical protein
MALASWPSGLPQVPNLPAGSTAPYQAPVETEMEDGPARARRSTTSTWTAISYQYLMTAAQYAVFEAFVRDTLQHGTAQFMIPIWRPGARLPLPQRRARISGGLPSWAPFGPKVMVTLPLSILDF